ncbi:MAG: carboxypeptidase regulatory-like domain-containing protein [Candidatus Cloacimonetes bacterium]|nr:carboxypeptidase regulatory-like domain-containing protein [Candidatus Cloacimonadota bacterium]
MNKEKKESIVKLLLGLVMLVFLGSGCTGSNNPLYIAPPGVIEGTVLDAAANPVQSVNVILENQLQNSGSVQTDAAGKFSIKSADPGVYDLVASKTIQAVSYKARVRYLNVHDQALTATDIKIKPAGVITGKVILEGKTTNEGVVVTLEGTGKTSTSDAAGNYSFTDVAYTVNNLSYTIGFFKNDFALAKIEDIGLVAGDTIAVETITLQNLNPDERADLSGSVRLDSKTDLSGLKIELLGTTINPVEIVSSSTNPATFEFKNLPFGSYIIKFSHDDYLPQEIPLTLKTGQPNVVLPEVTLLGYWHLPENIKASELTLSPGGFQLAYCKDHNSNTSYNGDIFLTDLHGTSYNQKITFNGKCAAGRGLSWSNDGKLLAYTRKVNNDPGAFTYVALISSSGGDITKLISETNDVTQPSFAPDNNSMIYQYSNGAGGQLVESTLTLKKSGYVLENEVMILNTLLNDQVGVNQFTSIEYGLSGRIIYSQNGVGGISNKGAFTLPNNANGNTSLIFTINTQLGLEEHAITYNLENDKLAFSVLDGTSSQNGIYMCNIDGTNAERISSAYGLSLEITDDGKYIYFIDKRASYSKRITRLIVPSQWR